MTESSTLPWDSYSSNSIIPALKLPDASFSVSPLPSPRRGRISKCKNPAEWGGPPLHRSAFHSRLRHCSEIFGDGPASTRVLSPTPSLLPLPSPGLLLCALYFCTFENHFVSLTLVSYNIKCRVLLAPGEGFCGPSQVLLRVHPTSSQVQVPDNPWQKNRDRISAAHACGGPRWREFHLWVCLGNISSRLSLFPSI